MGYQVASYLPSLLLAVIALITIAMLLIQQPVRWMLVIVNILVILVAAILWVKS